VAGRAIGANANGSDIRDVFTRDLELPRGPERQRVWAGDSDVRLRGSEVRTLATVGAFRVVPAGRDSPRAESSRVVRVRVSAPLR
jgi:hypothetical protein